MSKTQNNQFADLIELIVNEDEKAAKKLFHDIVVEQSRTIYEGLIDDEDLEEGDDIEDMVDDVESDEEGLQEGIRRIVSVAEAKQLLDYIDGTLNEANAGDLLARVAKHLDVTMEGLIPALEAEGDELLDVAYGDDEEEELGFGDEGGEESDFDMDGEMDDHEMDHSMDDVEDDGQEERLVDLEDGFDELTQKFNELIGDEGMDMDADDGMDDMGDDMDDMESDDYADDMGDEGMDYEEDDDVEESLVREYVEKVTAPVTSDAEQESPNTKSIVAGKNDMGGTTANIVGDQKDEKGAGKVAVKDIDSRSYQNDPKAKAGKTSFKKKETAKKADAPENKKSILDGPKGK